MMQSIDSAATEKPSILQLMVENPIDVQATIELLKEEVVTHLSPKPSKPSSYPSAGQFSSFSNLFTDMRVKQIVNDVAGDDAVEILNRALGVIDSGCSTEVKRSALNKGVLSMRSNLKELDALKDNQTLNFAASLIGVDQKKLTSFYGES